MSGFARITIFVVRRAHKSTGVVMWVILPNSFLDNRLFLKYVKISKITQMKMFHEIMFQNKLNFIIALRQEHRRNLQLHFNNCCHMEYTYHLLTKLFLQFSFFFSFVIFIFTCLLLFLFYKFINIIRRELCCLSPIARLHKIVIRIRSSF